jgi:lipoyl(octanoyl) transferase
VQWLGRTPYGEATVLQHRIRDAVLAGELDEHLLLLEHPHVFTLGRNATTDDVLADERWRREHQVELYESDRGGQVTYHGPGQLVGYPILDLKPDRRDVRRYIRDLQEVLLRTLADFGVVADPGLDGRPIGVWVGERKIASIGVHLRQWVTTHGFALNVSTDLHFFSGVVACGMREAPVTSIAALQASVPTLPEVADKLAQHFCSVFEREATAAEPEASPSGLRLAAEPSSTEASSG